MKRHLPMICAGLALGLVAMSYGASRAAAPALDFEVFKTRVEPIFLKKRESHERCYGCHSVNGSAFRLEPLAAGATFWTDEQSRNNFASVSALVNTADPAMSRFLIHPLAPEAGGDTFHSGGRQFASKNDPDWKTMAQWAGALNAGGPDKEK
jgi:hypothetical protein